MKDYGAVGDGVADDTAAISRLTRRDSRASPLTNSSDAAMADGNRCGDGCGSSTTSPAVVYFPPGTYKISAPIISWYYTQMIGDAKNIPVITAAPNFEGIAMIGESSL